MALLKHFLIILACGSGAALAGGSVANVAIRVLQYFPKTWGLIIWPSLAMTASLTAFGIGFYAVWCGIAWALRLPLPPGFAGSIWRCAVCGLVIGIVITFCLVTGIKL